MGFLLKIILFGVAIYAVWKTFARWKGLYDRFVGNPPEPARRPPAAAAPPRSAADARSAPARSSIEDRRPAPVCGAYVSAAAEKCGQCGRPLP